MARSGARRSWWGFLLAPCPVCSGRLRLDYGFELCIRRIYGWLGEVNRGQQERITASLVDEPMLRGRHTTARSYLPP